MEGVNNNDILMEALGPSKPQVRAPKCIENSVEPKVADTKKGTEGVTANMQTCQWFESGTGKIIICVCIKQREADRLAPRDGVCFVARSPSHQCAAASSAQPVTTGVHPVIAWGAARRAPPLVAASA